MHADQRAFHVNVSFPWGITGRDCGCRGKTVARSGFYGGAGTESPGHGKRDFGQILVDTIVRAVL